MTPDASFAVKVDLDLVTVRQAGRDLALALGFTRGEAALVATAISELARNILQYAGEGEVTLRTVGDGPRRGLTIIATDAGPGIPDLERAQMDGYSTSGGLGLGLPGVRRLMDELEVQSRPGEGTRVVARKWVP